MTNDWRHPSIRLGEVEKDFEGRFGRLVPVTLDQPHPDSEARCAECGRDIFRPWIKGLQEPWKHWVEPLDHEARPA